MLRPQLAQLDRRRNQLARTGQSLTELNRTLLAPRLLEFELRKAASAQPPLAADPASLGSLLEGVLELDKPVSELDSFDLILLHRRVYSSEEPLRRTTRNANGRRPQGPPPARIPHALDRFFEWVSCQAFAELHPVEQMAIAQTRLLEIDPFSTGSDSTASIFTYRFPLAAGYLLPAPDPQAADQFWTALQAAWEFSTLGLVELNLRAMQRAYDRVAPPSV